MTFTPEQIPPEDLILAELVDFTKPLISKDGELDIFLSFDNLEEEKFIKEALAKLSSKINIDFNFVDNEESADLSIFFKGDLSTFPGTVIGLAVPLYDKKKWRIYLNDKVLLQNYAQLYNTTLHELGHVLGLEHPFENSDGDFFRSTNPFKSAYPEETVMSYRDPITGFYPTDFTENDLRALTQIWGERVNPQQKLLLLT